ncbi:amidohydrolase family protein [Halococcus sediminicola]|uniref:amidohydrolase family protein n=1 Tax=Halococcus sediminicola TaxID=1264579 RepID=UPI000A9F44B9
MAEFIVTGATTRSNEAVDIEIQEGVIDCIVPAGEGDPTAFDDDQHYDAAGKFITPPLIEPHIHLDAALTAGDPCWNDVGTLAAGIDIWEERKQDLTTEDVKERAEQVVEWLAANGVTRVRTHADVTEHTHRIRGAARTPRRGERHRRPPSRCVPPRGRVHGGRKRGPPP